MIAAGVTLDFSRLHVDFIHRNGPLRRGGSAFNCIELSSG